MTKKLKVKRSKMKSPMRNDEDNATALIKKLKRKAQDKPKPGKWVLYKRRKVILFNRRGEPEDVTPFPLGKSKK